MENHRCVAARLAGGGDFEGADAGKPDCYGVSKVTGYCVGAIPSSRRNMSLKLLGE